MLARMFGGTSAAVPPDFGVLVTKDNVEDHLISLRKQVKPIDMEAVLKGQ